jgi:Rod binding domain-containing protein
MAVSSTNKPVANGNIEQLRKTAQNFEASFLSQMLKPMFANLGAAKPFGGGTGEDMWRSLQVNEYGKAIAQKGGIGLADSVFREMLKLQEVK